MRAPLEVRFYSKVAFDGANGCWRWFGSKANGYGRMRRPAGTATAAHRISWELHVGPIPPGLVVCHRCDNPECCNPEHLFLGTLRDNTQDAISKGRYPFQNGVRRSPGASGIFGITREASGRYRARIWDSRRTVALGTFDTAEEAIEAYDQAKDSLQQFLDARPVPHKQLERGQQKSPPHHNYSACRCDECHVRQATAQRVANAKRMGTEPPAHGYGGYVNYACRCEVCTRANSAYSRAARQRRRTVRA